MWKAVVTAGVVVAAASGCGSSEHGGDGDGTRGGGSGGAGASAGHSTTGGAGHGAQAGTAGVAGAPSAGTTEGAGRGGTGQAGSLVGAGRAGSGAPGGGGLGGNAGNGMAGASAGAPQGTGAVWSDIPAGDGPRADEYQAACESQCKRDGMCGFWDAGPCILECADPRKRCSIELASDMCWTLNNAFTSCQAALGCADLEHFYFDADTPDRPCRAEATALTDNMCAYVELGSRDECWGPLYDCENVTGTPISPYWVCDGELDCKDGSDEAYCPWLMREAPGPDCVPAAVVDGHDSTGDVAALAGVTCIDTLQIQSSTLTNLVGLESVTQINHLIIGETPDAFDSTLGNSALLSLHGLEGLTHLASLTIGSNPKLADLSALAGITEVTSDITVTGNDSLESLSGLDHVASVSTLTLADDPVLTSLQGLHGLTQIGGLIITGDPLLKTLVGLESVTSITPLGLTVENNAVLTSVTALSALATLNGAVTIDQNPKLPSCNVSALLTPLGATCTCSGNDDGATCP